MAEEGEVDKFAELKRKRQFKKFMYRGIETEELITLPNEKLAQLVPARARRRFQRGLKRKPMALIKKLRKAKKDISVGEKPPAVKTHLRNMIVVPEMIGSIIAIHPNPL